MKYTMTKFFLTLRPETTEGKILEVVKALRNKHVKEYSIFRYLCELLIKGKTFFELKDGHFMEIEKVWN